MKKHKAKWMGGFLLLLIGIIAFFTNRSHERPRYGIGGADYGSSKGGASTSHAVVKGGNLVMAFISAFQTPIEFYGKVVDQHGDPVAGASITILPFDNAFGSSDTKMMLVSDASGEFSVKGLKGLAMGVETYKEGYLTYSDLGFEKPASAHRIEYGLDGTKGARFKDPQHPTRFTLYKLGPLEPMIYVEDTNWRLPVDGKPRQIALDSVKGVGAHQIEFRFTSDWNQIPSGKRWGKQYNWSLEASIPGGGFCKMGSDYSFEAPESGYEEKIGIGYPVNTPAGQWQKAAYGKYFVKFADGIYGRIRFSIEGDSDMSPLMMTSWMSLKPGSRNLASDKKDATVWFDH